MPPNMWKFFETALFFLGACSLALICTAWLSVTVGKLVSDILEARSKALAKSRQEYWKEFRAVRQEQEEAGA